MANSLRDQFLKMGLVDKNKVNQVNKTTYKQTKEQDKGRLQTPDENKIQARQALAEKKEQARIANRKQQVEARHKEESARIRQLIATNHLSLQDGSITYRFTDGNKVARLLLPTREMVDGLSQGQLAIVRGKETYVVVPSSVAEKIKEWQPDLVVVHNIAQPEPQADPDDPYAAYQIPDDLIW